MSTVTEITTCASCVNFKSGICEWRKNSPDYPTPAVSKNTLSCNNYNLAAKRKSTDERPVFDNLPSALLETQHATKSHDYRKVLELSVINTDELHRLGIKDQHYPVLAVRAQHRGETAVFFLPNTVQRSVALKNSKRPRRVAGHRYDVADMFKRVADKGIIQLSNWRRVQVDI